jgi:acetyl esterase/lipase
MWFNSVRDYLESASAQTRPGWARCLQRRTPRRRQAARLAVEPLEDRCLLSGGKLSFMDPVDYAAGRSPRSVATGDFRGIGVLDLAVADSGSNDVSIFFGNGDGTFRLAETVAVGTNPYYVTTGHFHDPGILDLAVANSGSNEVSVLLGHGDGSFGLPHNFSVGRNPQSIAVGEFHAAGIQDLAVANRDSNSVSILLGDGHGTFHAGATLAVGGLVTAVAAGDFTGNGHRDLALTISDATGVAHGRVSIWLGDGTGAFQPGASYVVGTFPSSVAVSDFDGDGIADLAEANVTSDNVSILLGNGDGTFNVRTYQVGGQPTSITVTDVNGDGIPDIVTANRYATVSVLSGRGDGTFAPSRDFWAGADPVSLAVGDFNGDGKQDVAVAQLYSNQISILLNNGPQPADAVTVVHDIQYYNGPFANPARENLDLYLPASGTNFPVVLLVYGGGDQIGEKSKVAFLARSLAREGLAVVTPNYRLTDGTAQQVLHPGHVEDVARAFVWTYNHIVEYGGDLSNIFLMGHSSGAVIVSQLATDKRYLAAQGLSTDVIKGVISFSGTYDLSIRDDLAYAFGDAQQRWEASPIHYLDGTQPPFLLLYAQFDNPGLPEQSQTFYNALLTANDQAELHQIADRNHTGNFARSARPGDPAREFVLRFIAEHTTAPPRVASVVVNDGSAQRSMVTSLTVTFSSVVTLASGAFELRRQDGTLVGLNVTPSAVGGQTVAVLTFTGEDVIAGSLADGSYTLVTHAGLIHDDLGRTLAGGDRIDTFFRLFGDADGDGHVGLDDLRSFLSTLGKRAGDPGYLGYFDYDGDGRVDFGDLLQLLRRLGP